MRTSKTQRGRILAVAIGLTVVGTVGASAASLGGVDANDLGAGTGVVASCDTNGIDVEYRMNYHRQSGQYRVRRVILRSISGACAGQPYRLTLFDAGGGSRTVSGNSLNVTNIRDRDPGPGVDMAGVARINIQPRFPAERVDGIALVIGGAEVTP